MTPAPRIVTFMPIFLLSGVRPSAVFAVVAVTKAGQNFVGNRLGVGRQLLQALVRADDLDEAAQAERARGKRRDINGDAVHRYAPDDRQTYALKKDRTAATQLPWQAVGIAACDRRQPRFMGGDVGRTVADLGAGGNGARLHDADLQADNGPHRVRLTCDRRSAVERDTRARERAAIVRPEKNAAGIGKADVEAWKLRGNVPHCRLLIGILNALRFVGGSEVAH